MNETAGRGKAKEQHEAAGIGLNNVLNVRYYPANDWWGQNGWAEVGDNGKFSKFKTVESGLRAGLIILKKYRKEGVKKLGDIINRFAPPKDKNKVGAYIQHITDETGLRADDEVDESKYDALLRAMAHHETRYDVRPEQLRWAHDHIRDPRPKASKGGRSHGQRPAQTPNPDRIEKRQGGIASQPAHPNGQAAPHRNFAQGIVGRAMPHIRPALQSAGTAIRNYLQGGAGGFAGLSTGTDATATPTAAINPLAAARIPARHQTSLTGAGRLAMPAASAPVNTFGPSPWGKEQAPAMEPSFGEIMEEYMARTKGDQKKAYEMARRDGLLR